MPTLIVVSLLLALLVIGAAVTCVVAVSFVFGVPGLLTALLVLAAALIFALVVYVLVFRVHALPLRLFGLRHIPAVPIQLWEVPVTVVRLLLRAKQMQLFNHTFSHVFTIGGRTATAHSFMYGKGADEPLTALSLQSAEQFSMSWPTLNNLYDRCAAELLPKWARSLTSRAEATAQFWPTISNYGLPFNLVILEKVSADRAVELSAACGSTIWAPLAALQANGRLHVIDTSLLNVVEMQTVKGFPRFTPATLVFLERRVDAATGAVAMTPLVVRVSGANGVGTRFYDSASTDDAWLYALLAAKTSVTVWGIWLGHVYHWHIVTAAMQMTMIQTLPRDHMVRQLFGRQSQFLIGFDETLVIGWPFIAPPTSITTGWRFLKLMDAFAMGREFFDDDVESTLDRLGLRKQDFTVTDDWDQYPLVAHLTSIWKVTSTYVTAVVNAGYDSDADVAGDDDLQDWISASGDETAGNIKGLPRMDTKAALTRLMTSLIFRITAHGATRTYQGLNPAMTFVPNYPPCLHSDVIPEPTNTFGPDGLFAYLPKTGTLGETARFYGIFSYSTPYKSLVPLGGIDAELSFTGAASGDCNQALRAFRSSMVDFMTHYAAVSVIPGPGAVPDSVQVHQWPLNIET